jgi:hypothetical protein
VSKTQACCVSKLLLLYDHTKINTSSLLVVIVLTAVLLAWWRTILKVLAVTVLLLTSIGMAEVMSALIGGLTSH